MSRITFTKTSACASAWLTVCCFMVSAQVPTPVDFLGYELGDRFTRHHKVVDYAQTLSAGSDKASWVAYGKTSEYRDLGLLIIASPETFLARATTRLLLLRLPLSQHRHRNRHRQQQVVAAEAAAARSSRM